MTGPVRVLHVLPDLALGGGQRLVLDLAVALRPDVEVEVAYLAGAEDMRGQFEAAGVPVHVVPAGSRGVRELVRLVRSRRIDVLHAHSSSDKHVAQVAGLLSRRPVVAHLHVRRDHATRDSGLGGRLRSSARRGFGLLTVRRYVAISDAVRAVNVPDVPFAARRLELVRNGLPLDPYDTSPATAGRVADDGAVLLWAGRFSAEKDVPSLVRMMTHLRTTHPRARLLLAGTGTREQEVRRLVDELGLQDTVELVGRQDDMPRLLAQADVFVFASVSEGFGLAVAEAQAAGLPVVAFRIPALEEIIDDGRTGTLVAGRDPAALADAVRPLLDDPVLRAEWGGAGRARAQERFDIRGTADGMRAVYADVAGRASV